MSNKTKRTVTRYHFGGCWQWGWLAFWILVFFPVAIFYYFAKRHAVTEEVE